MSENIKKQLFSGVAYTALAKYAGIFINLGITAVLSRLLRPEDFGVIAISTVLITFFNIFCDLGFGPAIIQNKTLNKHDLINIFSFTFWLGVIISVIFFLISPLIARYYNNGILIIICRLLSVNLLFATLNIVPNALLIKEKRFKFISLRTFFVQFILGLFAVFSAFYGLDIYSLLIMPIGSSIIIFGINYYQNTIPMKLFSFKLKSIEKILSFSLYQFLFNFTNYFSRNLDKLLIGRYIGMYQLGYYEKSYRLMLLPLSNITHVITPVMFPVFSDYQDNKDLMLKHYLKVIKLLCFIGFPLSALLYHTSSELIYIIFGNQWGNSIPVFKILTFSVSIQLITSTLGSVFQANNGTKYLFQVGIINTIINVLGIIITVFLYKTMEAVAYGVVLTFIVNMFISFWYLFNFIFNKKIYGFLKVLVLPLILFIGLHLLLYFTPTISASLFLSLIYKSIISIGVTLVFLQITNQYDLLYYINKISLKIKKI